MHFAELNGDGLIDIVYGRYNNDKKAYLNNGSKSCVDDQPLPVFK
jgi:hypothetical protein